MHITETWHPRVGQRRQNSDGGYFARALHRDARGNRREMPVRDKTQGPVRRLFNEKAVRALSVDAHHRVARIRHCREAV